MKTDMIWQKQTENKYLLNNKQNNEQDRKVKNYSKLKIMK